MALLCRLIYSIIQCQFTLNDRDRNNSTSYFIINYIYACISLLITLIIVCDQTILGLLI